MTAIRAALERAERGAPSEVQHVVMGQVLQAGQGQIPSRQAQIKAGIPKEVSSETINKVCASGMRAVGLLDAADPRRRPRGRRRRRHGVDVATRPYLLKQARFGFRMGDAKAIDAMIHDGLRNPFRQQMFDEADDVAAEFELTRADMDPWALRSHQLAIAGDRRGPPARGDRPGHREGPQERDVVEIDEAPAPRHDAGEAREAPGAFGADGTHTAGNSPGVNDGAGALVLASDEWAEAQQQARSLATILAQAAVADDFAYLARTPAKRGEAALDEDRPVGRATSTSGRSTRRSRPWP